MEIVKCLVSSGADINLRSNEGRSPLFVASQQGHVATNNGDCPPSSGKLISAPALSKHLTTSQTMHRREQEGKEEIIYTREEKDETN
jgi:ankyrin repeat protein